MHGFKILGSNKGDTFACPPRQAPVINQETTVVMKILFGFYLLLTCHLTVLGQNPDEFDEMLDVINSIFRQKNDRTQALSTDLADVRQELARLRDQNPANNDRNE